MELGMPLFLVMGEWDDMKWARRVGWFMIWFTALLQYDTSMWHQDYFWRTWCDSLGQICCPIGALWPCGSRWFKKNTWGSWIVHICIYKYLYLERERDMWSISHTTRVYHDIPCFTGLLYMMGIVILHLDLHVINTYLLVTGMQIKVQSHVFVSSNCTPIHHCIQLWRR